VTDVPIACTLTADGVVERVGEWREFLASMVQTIEATPTRAVLRLIDDDRALLAAVSLAEREKACCAFFEFSFAVAGSGTDLHMAVPAEAEEVLAGLLALRSSPNAQHEGHTGHVEDS
jgi:hypothetical protein